MKSSKKGDAGLAQVLVQLNGVSKTESNDISVTNVVFCSQLKTMESGIQIFLFGSKSGWLAEELFKI
mgnify:CR=1 FL=1